MDGHGKGICRGGIDFGVKSDGKGLLASSCMRRGNAASKDYNRCEDTFEEVHEVQECDSCLKFANCQNTLYSLEMRCFLKHTFIFLGFPLLLHAENTPPADSARGVWPSLKRTWHATVDGAEAAAKAAGSAVHSVSHSVVDVFSPSASKSDSSSAPKSSLKVALACTPSPLDLKQTRNLTVLVKFFNGGKKTQLLEFSSFQRVDAVLRDASGKIVSRATLATPLRTDEPALVTVNPGERLEYALSLPTVGMIAGKAYRLEAALVGQSGLTAAMEITPK